MCKNFIGLLIITAEFIYVIVGCILRQTENVVPIVLISSRFFGISRYKRVDQISKVSDVFIKYPVSGISCSCVDALIPCLYLNQK